MMIWYDGSPGEPAPLGEPQHRGRVRRCHQHSEETTCMATQGIFPPGCRFRSTKKNLQSYEIGEVMVSQDHGKDLGIKHSFLFRNLKIRKGSVAKKGQHSVYLITAPLRMLGKKFNWSHAIGWLLFRTKRFSSVLAALGQASHGSACSNVSLFQVFITHDTTWSFSWRFTQPIFCCILAWTHWDLEKLTFFI